MEKYIFNYSGPLGKVIFENNKVELTNIEEGTFLSSDYSEGTSFITSTINESNTNGWLEINATRLGGNPAGVDGNGDIARLTFKAKSILGANNIEFSNDNTCIMRDAENNEIIYVGQIGTIVNIY
mgnify:CR=1 FL=1